MLMKMRNKLGKMRTFIRFYPVKVLMLNSYDSVFGLRGT